jgi:homoserine trans-succinylase
MKTNQTMTKTLMRAARPGWELDLGGGANAALFEARSKQSFIQWHTEREIQDVSKRLARIQQAGIRLEGSGDYFKSEDLAYQIQEIIRATDELFKKSQRAKG